MSDLNTVSYNQFDDIPSLGTKSKIIFSEKAYMFLNSLINETKNDNKEEGCYLVGRKSISEDGALCFYFDFCSSKFQTTDGIYSNSGVISTNSNKRELINELDKYMESGIQACIMHFHTHTLNGIFSSLSDQDYGVYATMKHQLKCEVFGMLAAPNNNLKKETTELSVLICQDPKVIGTRGCASFYSIPNIYYVKGSEIYQVGTFRNNEAHSKTVITELSRRDRFVQNYREWKGSSIVSGIGINPDTGLQITDKNVGYIDINKSFIFQDENLALQFPDIEEQKVDKNLN